MGGSLDSIDEIEAKLEEIFRKEERKYKRIKDDDYFKVKQLAFDQRTIRSLLKLFNKGVLYDITWVISAGKESLVMAGLGPEGEVAIKVYRVYTANFKKYIEYLAGDYRFVPVKDRDKIIRIWAKKEFRNLKRMRDVGVNVPRPVDVSGNVLVMEFIGQDATPAPLLKDVEQLPNPKATMESIIEDIKKTYQEAELVHGDLSEYNIMYWRETHWIIDVSQAVVITHPLAYSLLLRDLERVTQFFYRRFKLSVPDPHKLAEEISE